MAGMIGTKGRRPAPVKFVALVATLTLTACAAGETGASGSASTDLPPTTEVAETQPGPGSPTNAYPTEEFVPSEEAGETPDLPQRVAYANLGDAEIFTVWGDAMEAAAEARDLEYTTASANFDPATNVEQINSFLSRGVGSMLVVELDAESQRPAVLEAMDQGVAVFTVVFGPGTSQLVTDQYASGEAAANAMVDHINTNLDGQAEILVFNLDDREGLRPRYQAVRDVVEAAGDEINIAVDQLGSPQTAEFGFEVMNTVLQSNAEVNVVIGEDAHVLGALAALEAAGVADDPGWLLVGIGGEQEALEKVAEGDSPFQIDVSFALPAIGAIPAVFGAEWLAGRSIPMVTEFNPIVLDSAEAVDQFLADMEDPEALIEGPLQETYLTHLGRISYETRTSYYDPTAAETPAP